MLNALMQSSLPSFALYVGTTVVVALGIKVLFDVLKQLITTSRQMKESMDE